MATTAASYIILVCLAIRASNDVAVFYNVYVALVDGNRADIQDNLDIADAYDIVIRWWYELEFPPARWIALEIMKLASRSFKLALNIIIGGVKEQYNLKPF